MAVCAETEEGALVVSKEESLPRGKVITEQGVLSLTGMPCVCKETQRAQPSEFCSQL